MLKRIAMWRLKESIDSIQLLELKEKLESLGDNIKYINSLEVGINISLSKSAYNIVFTAIFDSMERLREFEDDPYHQIIRDFVSKVGKSRIVVDYEC